MAKSVFSKNNYLGYFILLLVVAVLSISAAIGCYFYFGHYADGVAASEEFQNKLKLGGAFTTEELAADQGYTYSWIKAKDVTVEIYLVGDDEEEKPSDEIISYDVDAREFRVIGIAKGKIKFTNSADASVTYTVPFETEFASKDTNSILRDNYSHFSADGVITEEEIGKVTTLDLKGRTSADLADLTAFQNLQRLEIGSLPGGQLIEFSNFKLPGGAKIYVPNESYLGYMQRTESDWKAYSDRIFPEVSSSQMHSVVLYKQGGAFEDDNGMTYDVVEVPDNGMLDFANDYKISREGYRLDGWYLSDDGTTPRGDALTAEYKFTSDAKLCAKWNANTYTVRMYRNDNTAVYDDKLFTYDMEDVICDSLPTYTNYVLLGWAYDENATETQFDPSEAIKNLTSEHGDVIEVYAIWAYSVFTIQFNTWDTDKQYAHYSTPKSVNYGEEVSLSCVGGAPTSQYGSFEGWALTPDSSDVDFKYGETTDKLFVTSKTNGVLNLYAVIRLESYDIYYDADGGFPQPASQLTIARGVPCTISKAIERIGYRFKGWKDASGYIWVSQTLYDSDEDYYNENFVNKVKLLAENSEGWIAPLGIDTVMQPQITLIAVWQANQFTVTFTGDSYESSYYETQKVTYDQPATLRGELQKKGHSLSSCLSDYGNISLTGRTLSTEDVNRMYIALLGGSPNNEFNQNRMVTFTATWSANYYTITFDYNGGNPTTNSIIVKYGEKYGNVPATATRDNENYCNRGCCYDYFTFSHWEYEGRWIDSSTVMNVAASHVLKAVWDKGRHKKDHCLAEGTLITMADGTKKAVEDLAVGDMVLGIDHETGRMGAYPVAILIDHEREEDWRHICELHFDDGTRFKIIGMHSLFDLTLNCYVTIDLENADQYIGHEFLSLQNDGGEFVKNRIKLTSYELYDEVCQVFTVMSAYAWNVVAEGLLTIPPGEELLGEGGNSLGILNVFTFDSDLKWNEEEKQRDIEQYGLCDYSEVEEYLSETAYEILYTKYFKIMAGKGIIDMDKILEVLKMYKDIFKNM